MYTTEKKKEEKILSIISIILGLLCLVGSLFPFINFVVSRFAFLPLSLGLIALLAVKNRRKRLAWVGISLSLTSIIVAFYTMSLGLEKNAEVIRKIEDALDGPPETTVNYYYDNPEVEFKWTKEDYNNLQMIGYRGEGGTTYEEVVSKFGEPQLKNEGVKSDGVPYIYVVYSNRVYGGEKQVRLEFVKVKDESWRLFIMFEDGLLNKNNINNN